MKLLSPCDPMDCRLPGFSLHMILQARVLEWVAISFSRGSSWPRDWTRVSHIVGRCFTVWATREDPSKQQTKQKYKPNHQQSGLPPHSALPIRGKTNKQTNKNSAQISPYTKLTKTTGPTLGGQKPKGRKNSTFFKERIQLSLKPGKRRPQTQ